MFQFTGFTPIARWHVFNMPGCPIRISTDQKVCAPPRSFSQLITSFVVSESLGIRHTPLLNLLYFLLQYFHTIMNSFIIYKKILFCLKYCYSKHLYLFDSYDIILPICQWTLWIATDNKLSILILQYSRDNINYLQELPGGEYRSRTDDLLRARQAL